jgi:hypothetical protein
MTIQIPPELFVEWLAKGRAQYEQPGLIAGFVAEKAAEWAADQMLDACCKAIVEQIITIPALGHGITPATDNTGFSGPAGVLHMGRYSSWPAFAQMVSRQLRTAMRPRPPSLKDQALQALIHLENGALHSMDTIEPANCIRRALESIPDADS